MTSVRFADAEEMQPCWSIRSEVANRAVDLLALRAGAA